VRWLSFLLAFQQAQWIDVPFIAQDKNGCGSASIWMVMMYWQPDAMLDVHQIHRQLYSENAGGIHANDMARYFEAHGYRAIAFSAEWADLEEHVAKGRPLIVCLERNSRGVPLHYVVVAGIDSVSNLVLINDPAQRKLVSMSRVQFEQYWRATGNWALLAVPELDLASKAFRDANLSETRDHLHSALRLQPEDAYTNEFLATVYFLQNNTEAALKHWNRAGKPRIENIRIDPPLRIDPVLLDRAFAFSRGSILASSDFETTQARLTELGIFTRFRMDLSPAAAEDGFDLTLRAAERSGVNWWVWGRGLPFQSVTPELPNIAGKAVNIGSTLRWDPNKRRGLFYLEAPLDGNPGRRLRLTVDGRDENWASTEGDFHMRKIMGAAEVRSAPSGRWSWSSGAGVARTRFSNSLASGFQLKYSGSLTRTLLRDPSRRLNLRSALTLEAGKLWTARPARFAKVVNTTSFQWRSVTSELRLGNIAGNVPFDERFVIGLERDTDLWLRAHRATVNGRKNAANMGRAFILTNSDVQKTVLNAAWFQLSAGPFLDTGKYSSSSRWLIDTGIELRLSILGSVGMSFSYGRSLSDSQQAFFLRQRGM
jgi:predicted double-glycine peptidase